MNRRIWVNVNTEVDVDLDRDAFNEWLHEMIAEDKPSTCHSLACLISRFYTFVRDLPDEILSEVPEKGRETLAGGLRRLADRLETGSTL